jgi:Tol biopolymer transport system component/DNA-binding winged helix-turn-helix (wHTH) protein
MNEPRSERKPPVRFGVFELDPWAGELRKAGTRLTLQQQPLRLLAVLLERPGELVTRDELRKCLWPEDTFVDFERGLNTAVKRLRDTLGDPADNPIFIETLPRRGYRFIAPVTATDAPARPAEGSFANGRRRTRWLVGLAALAGAVVVAAIFWGVRREIPSAGDSRGASAAGPIAAITRVTSGPHLDTDATVSPDGEWLAFASDRAGEGHLDIWMQRLTGGEPVRLTRDPGDEREPTFSADGSRLAFTSGRADGGIYTMPAHSGGEASVLVRGGAHSPSFSPDGRWLAFSTGPGRFSADKATAYISRTFLVPATGGQPTKLLPDFESAVWPVWSPDGRYLLLTARRRIADAPEWWVVAASARSAVGTAIRLPADARRYPMRPWKWRDGNRIIYSAAFGGDSWDLWEIAISPDESRTITAPKRLTTGAGLQASPSMVGKTQLIFASLTHTVNVWSLPLDASSGEAAGPPERLTSSSAIQMMPSASADGRVVAFLADKPAGGGLWTRRLDTGRETFLVAVPARLPITMAPDGSRVAYTIHGGKGPVIFSVPTSGGVPEQICVDCGESYVQSWSRDNARLLYLDGTPISVFVLDLRTGRRTLLLRRQHDLYWASFSPDERWIAALETVFDEGRSRVWAAPLRPGSIPAAGDWIAITNGESWDDRPRWSTDGNLLYFTSLRDGFHCLWAQRVQPETKRPIGAAFAVHHFHNPRLSVNNTGLIGFELAVARDRLFVNLGELSGNIWTAHMR